MVPAFVALTLPKTRFNKLTKKSMTKKQEKIIELGLKRIKASEEMLDIIDHADEMTRSDLQGVVDAFITNLTKTN